ncbi:MAG: hypothetical protein PHW10_05500 [Candidatus Peribacteraceae bacterium]|nr:hypothetical protein [Candidatus Peribacteraceae bacterium]
MTFSSRLLGSLALCFLLAGCLVKSPSLIPASFTIESPSINKKDYTQKWIRYRTPSQNLTFFHPPTWTIDDRTWDSTLSLAIQPSSDTGVIKPVTLTVKVPDKKQDNADLISKEVTLLSEDPAVKDAAVSSAILYAVGTGATTATLLARTFRTDPPEASLHIFLPAKQRYLVVESPVLDEVINLPLRILLESIEWKNAAAPFPRYVP